MKTLNCKVVGKSQIGKTSLIESFRGGGGAFPGKKPGETEFIAKHSSVVTFKGDDVNLAIWETNLNRDIQADDDDMDILIVCLSLAYEGNSLMDKSEIDELCAGRTFILVGTKSDLKEGQFENVGALKFIGTFTKIFD
jgi:GTPase SAR1 family protein